MKYGITTSIRLPPELREQLEEAAQVLHRGKNWIVKEALSEYLVKHAEVLLMEEARKQSILASKSDNKENEPWDDDTDTNGWA